MHRSIGGRGGRGGGTPRETPQSCKDLCVVVCTIPRHRHPVTLWLISLFPEKNPDLRAIAQPGGMRLSSHVARECLLIPTSETSPLMQEMFEKYQHRLWALLLLQCVYQNKAQRIVHRLMRAL